MLFSPHVLGKYGHISSQITVVVEKERWAKRGSCRKGVLFSGMENVVGAVFL